MGSLKILYDGACPLCLREMRLLKHLDRQRGQLTLEDISADGFNPDQYGLSMGTLQGQIHGVLSNGQLVKGMEVFRRAYAAVGLGWLLAPTAWPGLRWIADLLYRWFARHRLWLTGRNSPCSRKCHWLSFFRKS